MAQRSEIRNRCWFVRHYHRNTLKRAQAIQALGLILREAFNNTDNFEPLLAALLEGLKPHDDPPF